MTCIVALAQNGALWMGADSAGVGNYRLQIRRDPKIYRVGDMLIGFTTSFRMGQLLGYRLTLPHHREDWSVEKYMHIEFIDAVRNVLKSGGYSRTKDGTEEAGTFLVGYRGRIFQICDDYQIAETEAGFDAVGSGIDVALGSLHTSVGLQPQERVTLALEAAARFNAGVHAPFIVEMLGP